MLRLGLPFNAWLCAGYGGQAPGPSPAAFGAYGASPYGGANPYGQQGYGQAQGGPQVCPLAVRQIATVQRTVLTSAVQKWKRLSCSCSCTMLCLYAARLQF